VLWRYTYVRERAYEPFDRTGEREVSTEQLLADLDALDAFFDSEAKWARGAMARDKIGRQIGPQNSAAVAWCISGGCEKVVEPERFGTLWSALRATLDQSPTVFNDLPTTAFSDIKSLISSTRARIAQEAAK
jgi:hypothetical protein